MSSELSNALNPYASQARTRTSIQAYSLPLQPAVQTHQQYVPHRSELELAISEPPPRALHNSRGQFPEGVHAVHELLRIVPATRDDLEIERTRRLAWEQQQESKYSQVQAEMEKQMLDMRQDITSLRTELQALRNTSNQHQITNSVNTQYNVPTTTSEQNMMHSVSPVSSLSQPTYSQSMFVQGSSSNPMNHTQPLYYDSSNSPFMMQSPQSQSQPSQSQTRSESTVVEGPPASVTPSPSPQIRFINESQVPSTGRKKRQNSELSSDDDENDSASSDSLAGRPMKRVSHHDRRCLTIHHAMRTHFLRVMGLDSDKDLPDSHLEGSPLDSGQLVRLVWDKTTKQSVHNSRMKARIIEDLKNNRRLYKHVPAKEFAKKVLDSAFEQCFTTFRQKFKTQRDSNLALNLKKREESKARKARHLSRRKLKLSNRADARMKLRAFEHVTFDGALQLDCMSSEESDIETDSSSSPQPLLRTRGFAWRSTRLIRFYYILDDEERSDKTNKPKRGIGKRERTIGPPKEGLQLPPKGVATWMISRRWFNSVQTTHPDLPDSLKQLIDDPAGFDWDHFDMLGNESEDEMTQTLPPSSLEQTIHPYDAHSHNPLQLAQQQHYSSSSSLHYAFS